MNGLRKLSLLAVTLLFGAFAAVAQKPNIHILATGGTIRIIQPDKWLSAHCWMQCPK